MHQHGDRFRLGVLHGWLVEQRTAPRQRRSPRAIGEQPKMPNAHEATRDDVQEKAPEEFVTLQRQDLHAAVVGIVLPAKTDVAIAVVDKPIIRQRDAVRVATEVVEHRLGAGEGPLGNTIQSMARGRARKPMKA
jgi:hypothetical protein